MPTTGARKIAKEIAEPDFIIASISPQDRHTTALSCVDLIKQACKESKNLKREVRETIERQAENLRELLWAMSRDKLRAQVTAPRRDSVTELTGITTATVRTSDTGPSRTEIAMLQKIEENNRLLIEHGKALAELKGSLGDHQEGRRLPSYAAAVADVAGARPPMRPALHSLVVVSKDDQKTGEELLNDLRRVAREDDGWITVERIRKARDRKVILGYKTADQREKAKGALEGGQGALKVETVHNKDPLLILYGVLKAYKDEEILRALRARNKNIFKDLDPSQDRMAIKFRRNARNPLTAHVVLQVSPTIWRKALDQETLHIDIQPVRVADQSPLVQCSLCLGYGHSRRFCKEAEPRCSHCGDKHLRLDCPKYRAGAEARCCNCWRAKGDDTAHDAFDRGCPVRIKWDNIARSATQYC